MQLDEVCVVKLNLLSLFATLPAKAQRQGSGPQACPSPGQPHLHPPREKSQRRHR